LPGGQRPNCLWVHNGNQVTGFSNSDPKGIIRRVNVLNNGTLIDYVIQASVAQDPPDTTGYLRLQRTITLSTGAMSAIAQVDSITFNPLAPPATMPTWLQIP
jgi:hypothetical protein